MMKSSLNMMTRFFVIMIGLLSVLFFGVQIVTTLTFSAEVIEKNLDQLNMIDAAHLVKSCLEGPDGIVKESDISGFSASGCSETFPGLSELGYEYRIEDREDPGIATESPGFEQKTTRLGHRITINIVTQDGVHVGRIYVQEQ